MNAALRSGSSLIVFIVFVSCSDPNSRTTFSDYLYSNDGFAKALSASLNGNGVLVAQVGEGTVPLCSGFFVVHAPPDTSVHFF